MVMVMPCARHLLASVLLLVALAAAVPASALAASAPPAAGALSPRLEELSAPGLAAASPTRQDRELSLPLRGPGSLQREGGAPVVEILLGGRIGAGLERLRRAGAELLHLSNRYRTVTAAVPERALGAVADVERVRTVNEVLEPLSGQTGGGSGASTSAACTPAGFTSEADTQLRAAQARSQFGVDGSGIEVGVLSDTYDRSATAARRASDDVASGDLPGPGNPCGRTTPVDVRDDGETIGSDEGRAMAQLVHDLAPGSRLSFATAFTSETAFADNIRDLRSAGADVIVDDVSYFSEPFFQDGPVSVAVNDVTSSGAVYYSSAGNSNSIVAGKNVSGWEAPSFRDSNSCPLGLPAYATHCMDFDPGAGVDDAFEITVGANRTLRIALQWAEPRFGVETDIDAYLRNAAGVVVSAPGGENDNSATQQPFEFVSFENPLDSPQTLSLSINRYTGAASPRLKFIALGGSSTVVGWEYPTSAGGDLVGRTIFGHNGAANAISTAAVPYDNPNVVEGFSSRGPLSLYYAPVTGTSPAPVLATPQTLAKPDLSATDGVVTSFFPSGVGTRFYGTSAAAPHAAAVAALQLDRNPFAGVAAVKSAQLTTADPVGSFGPGAAGAGLLDAVGAVGATATEPAPPSPEPEIAPPDISGPTVEITAKPRKRTRRKIARFTFGTLESGASFECGLDGRALAPCSSPKQARVGRGRHVFRVRPRDSAGNAGPQASYAWKVKRRRRR